MLAAKVRIGRQNGLAFLTMAGRTHEHRRLTRGRIATRFPSRWHARRRGGCKSRGAHQERERNKRSGQNGQHVRFLR